MSLQDVRDPAGFDAVWLIRHLAACLTRRRPLPPQVVRALRARALTLDEALSALADLNGPMPGPIGVGPPCSTGWTVHEALIGQAAAALARDDPAPAAAAVAALAGSVPLTAAQARKALAAVERLAGHGPSRRDRCSSGKGGVAIARTASEISATALSSPATRLARSSPHC